MIFFWAFLIGGLFCAVAQIVLDVFPVTPAQILVLFVVLGTVLGGLGLYAPLIKFAGAGASVPLPGFGYTLVKGIGHSVKSEGFLGVFTGGLTAASAGIKAAIIFGLLASLIFRPKA